MGAIVNDVIVPLDHPLTNNDIVQIKTNPNSTPSKEWLSFVKTSHAKNKIRSYFSKQEKEEIISKGKNLLQNELRKRHLAFDETLSNDHVKEICKELHLNDINDLYFSIGSLRYTAASILSIIMQDKKSPSDALIEKMMRNNKGQIKQNKNAVLVAGKEDILTTLANCCHPVYGDEIKGFITKGNGIKIHRANCENIKNEKRVIEVSWNEEKNEIYETSILIESSQNNLLDIISKATTKNINIKNIKTKTNDYKIFYEISLKIKNKDELEDFINALYSLKTINKVERL